jgi:hypothetical protein
VYTVYTVTRDKGAEPYINISSGGERGFLFPPPLQHDIRKIELGWGGGGRGRVGTSCPYTLRTVRSPRPRKDGPVPVQLFKTLHELAAKIFSHLALSFNIS